jgi:poly-gamma-glutamate synthesis protein (capsule biosynthesis protein)
MTTLFVCGDIINCEHRDGIVCSGEMAKLVASADYSVCNFEGPIEGYGQPQPKIGKNLSQRTQTVEGLKEQGFDLLLLGNNHIMDFGPEGLAATINCAKASGLETTGAGLNKEAAYRPLIKDIGGLKIGLLNAGEAQFGVIDYFERSFPAGYAWINHSLVDRSIARLKDACDFVIVFSHAGLEHYSIPQKEWRKRYHHFCSLGADVVIGTHPHVPQGYEKVGDSLIFYSLGNFYSDTPNHKNKEDSSFAVWLECERNSPPRFKPVFHHKKGDLVRLSPSDIQVDLKSLCLSLGEGYHKAHDQMSLEAYERFRRDLVFSLTGVPYDEKFRHSLRRIASRLLGRSKRMDKTLLQLHLIRNEAHYYAARHALEIKAEEKNMRS